MESDLLGALADFECMSHPFDEKRIPRPRTVFQSTRMQRQARKMDMKDEIPTANYGRPSLKCIGLERKNANEPIRRAWNGGLRVLRQVLGLPGPGSVSREQALEAEEFRSREMLAKLSDIPSTRNPSITLSEPVVSAPLLDLPIFVAIDFEYTSYPKDPETGLPRCKIRELGIATLDTRDLYNQHYIPTRDLISTHHYRTQKKSMPFHFGKSVDVTEDQIATIIKRLLYLENEHEKPRKVILVGHSVTTEIHIMKNFLGIDVNLAHSVVDIFDTEFIAIDVLDPNCRHALHSLIRETDVWQKRTWLHNAAHDAHTTLRIMLLLATYSYDLSELDEFQKNRVQTVRKVARNCIKFPGQHPSYLEEREKRKKANKDFRKANGLTSDQFKEWKIAQKYAWNDGNSISFESWQEINSGKS